MSGTALRQPHQWTDISAAAVVGVANRLRVDGVTVEFRIIS